MVSIDNAARVRFAPSPTGHLHVGGARTALYNWLYARSKGGVFVLRIEDTDVSRSTEEAVEKIISSLKWLGLDWDEGPRVGGEYGPYRQMERAKEYIKSAEKLIKDKKAYRCYCTQEELDDERRNARKEGVPYVYGGRCRSLSALQEDELRNERHDYVIRLKTPLEGTTVVNDLIRGDVVFENALCGDFIIVRSNGVATYNFAVAIDDAGMEISHVIRGDDHLPNTPKQIMVLKALGKRVPSYAHLPLILGKDRSPLSKRHGDVSIEEFRAKGYVREALNNYLALLGWSYDGETTMFSIDELVEKFSIKRVGSTAAVFDIEKLLWMNGSYIRNMTESELAGRIDEYLRETRLAGTPGKNGRPTVAELVPYVQEKMKTLADFIELTDFFFQPVEYKQKPYEKLISDEKAVVLLRVAMQELKKVEPFEVEGIEKVLRAAAADMDIKLGKFLQPVRIALSGKTVTPGMFETIYLLGRDESISRLKAAIRLIEEDRDKPDIEG